MRTDVKTRATTPMAYVERVNLAIDYVVSHLEEPLRLEDVSRAALLSPFHFHRVFRALVGVTLAEFVKRLRLEKALFMMAYARRPSLSTIALSCGFSSSSDFSRCFRQRFGVPPSAFDIRGWCNAHRFELEATAPGTAEQLHVDKLPTRNNPDAFRVRVGICPHARWRTSASAIHTEETPSLRPPNGSSPGPNATRWQTASGSDTSGTIRRSLASTTASTTLPSKPSDSLRRARLVDSAFRRWLLHKSKCAAGSISSCATPMALWYLAPQERVRAR